MKLFYLPKWVPIFPLVMFFVGFYSFAKSPLNDPFYPTWESLYSGVDYNLSIAQTDFGIVRLHVVRIDLGDPEISLSAEKSSERKKKADAFLVDTESQLVFSAELAEMDLRGVSDVTKLMNEFDSYACQNCEDLTSYVRLVQNGRAEAFGKSERLARSAIGWSSDGQLLYFVLAEGGPRHGFFYKDLISIGLNASELAEVMLDVGAHNAYQIGSNRHIALAARSERGVAHVLNLPIDNRDDDGIALQTHIAVRAKPLDGGNIRTLTELVTEKIRLREFRNDLRSRGAADLKCFDDDGDNCPVAAYDNSANAFIRLEDLKLVDRKYLGEAKGGIFRDKHDVVWLAKAGYQPVNEYIAARLLHTFLPTQIPLVKLVADSEEAKTFMSSSRSMMTLSRQLPRFEPLSLRRLPDHRLPKNSGQLKVLMDWVGLGDRSENNQGYVYRGDEYFAARVDFDNAFDDKNGWFNWKDPAVDMKNQLTKDLENYSLSQLEEGLVLLSTISDKEIDDIVSTSCRNISITYNLENPCDKDPFNKLAMVLKVRKAAAADFSVRYQYFKRKIDNSDVHIVRVNHRKMDVKIEPSEDFKKPERVSSIAKRTNATIAINGGFWNFGPTFFPAKLILGISKKLGFHAYEAHPDSVLKTNKGGGRLVPHPEIALAWNPGEEPSLALFEASSPLVFSFEEPKCSLFKVAKSYDTTFAVSVYPILAQGKANIPDLETYDDIRAKDKAPRTGVCLHHYGEWNLVVAEHATLPEFGEFMAGLNCKVAGNLDGGGSSTLVINDKLIFGGNSNVLSIISGHERKVSDAIIVTEK